MKRIKGIIVPAVTPFDETGGIRFDWLRQNYEKWNRTPVGGYMCLGSNGEFRLISDDEALEVISCAAECASPDKVFIAGVGRESLTETLRFIDRVTALRLPIDYLSVLTPGYFRSLMTDEALIAYYTEIADYSELPILLYCAPSFVNEVTISAAALAVLADHPNIYGIKDTSKSMMDSYMDAVGNRPDFSVVSGSMSTIMKCLDRGGQGGVVSAANYFPSQCAEVVRLYEAGEKAAAEEYYKKLQALIKKTGARGSVAGVKCTMNLMGFSAGVPRKPVLPVCKEMEEEFRQALLESGFLSE